MSRTSTYIVLTYILTAALLVCGCQGPRSIAKEIPVTNEQVFNAEWVNYQTLEELAADADRIVLGEVQKVTKARPIVCGLNSDGTEISEVYTLSEIKIIDLIKGQGKAGEIISVGQPGGLYKNIRYTWNSVVYFQPGMRAVFFLDNPSLEGLDTPSFCLGPIQGYIPIQAGKTSPREGNQLIATDLLENSLITQLKTISRDKAAVTASPAPPMLQRQSIILNGQRLELLPPLNWSLAVSENLIDLADATGLKRGAITLVGYYDNYTASLPNHSKPLGEEDIDSFLGIGKLFVLERSHPAAANNPEIWKEIYAVIPIPNKNLAYLFWIQADPQENIEVNKDLLRFIINHIETAD